MDAFRLVATVLAMGGVVVAIMLFEKRRADRITRDTRRMARGDNMNSPPGEPHDDEGRAQ